MIKILVKDVRDLLNEDLTLQQRGFLISCILLKDSTPKLTYYKIKGSINLTKITDDLIQLHSNGLIHWENYEKAIQKKDQEALSPDVREILDFMNWLYNRKFKYSKTNIDLISSRLSDHSKDDIKAVIANRYDEWSGDENMKKFLRPSTIFRKSKFEIYLEDVESTGKGLNITTVNSLGINKGDEMDYKVAQQLTDNLIYSVKETKISSSGQLLGTGLDKKLRGSDIKSLLKHQDTRVKRGELRDFILIYNG